HEPIKKLSGPPPATAGRRATVSGLRRLNDRLWLAAIDAAARIGRCLQRDVRYSKSKSVTVVTATQARRVACCLGGSYEASSYDSEGLARAILGCRDLRVNEVESPPSISLALYCFVKAGRYQLAFNHWSAASEARCYGGDRLLTNFC